MLGNNGPGLVPGLALSLTESDSWVRTIKVRPPVGYTLHICFTWRGFEWNTSMDAAVYILHKRDTFVQADSGSSFSMDPMSLLPKDKLTRVNLVGWLWPLQQLVLEHKWCTVLLFLLPTIWYLSSSSSITLADLCDFHDGMTRSPLVSDLSPWSSYCLLRPHVHSPLDMERENQEEPTQINHVLYFS